MVFLLNVQFVASKRNGSVLEPCHGADGRTIAVFELEREAAERKQPLAAFVEVLECSATRFLRNSDRIIEKK